MKAEIEDHFQGKYSLFFERYLPNVHKIGGGEYAAICPFHDETNASFNFNNDKGTYFCHGCGKKGHAFHFYGKINGLDTRRDFPKILKGIIADFGIPYNGNGSRPKSNGSWPSMDYCKAVYDYPDAKGEYLFSVLRFEPPGQEKTFRQGIRNGNGWKHSIKGVDRVLFNLPGVGKADEILILEGEKDCLTASRLGFKATTSPMGAGKWRDEYSASLKGKDVILIPDNDLRGKQHMAKVGTALHGIAKSLKWVDLPDIPSKGDLSDWVENIGDGVEAGERLAVMIDRVDSYRPPQKDLPKKARGLSLDALSKKFSTTVEWVWQKHIPSGLPIILNGREGSGKTTIALQSAKEMLIQRQEGTVIFLASEGAVQDAIVKMVDIGLNAERFTKRFKVGQKANESFKWDFYLQGDRKELDELLNEFEPIICVFIDSIRGMSRLDDNDPKNGDIIHAINSIVCDKYRAGLVYLDHHGKGKKGNLLDKAVGSTAKTSSVRAVLSVLPVSKFKRIIKPAKANISTLGGELEVIKVGNEIIIREPQTQSDESLKGKAEEWLISVFSENPTMRAIDVYGLGEREGFSGSLLKSVKKELGIQSHRDGEKSAWKWVWPLYH
jgi:hypothetical protein